MICLRSLALEIVHFNATLICKQAYWTAVVKGLWLPANNRHLFVCCVSKPSRGQTPQSRLLTPATSDGAFDHYFKPAEILLNFGQKDTKRERLLSSTTKFGGSCYLAKDNQYNSINRKINCYLPALLILFVSSVFK